MNHKRFRLSFFCGASLFLSLLLAFQTDAGGAPALDTTSAGDMGAVSRYIGFSLPELQFARWYLDKSEQIPTQMTLRRRTRGAITVPLIVVRVGTLPHTALSPRDFGRMARQDRVAATVNRQVLSYSQKPSLVGGQVAIEFDLRMRSESAAGEQRAAPVTRALGLVVMLPASRDVAIAASFWQTARHGKFDGQIAREARTILRAIVLRPIAEGERSDLGELVY